mgnify:CR=1 FL=1
MTIKCELVIQESSDSTVAERFTFRASGGQVFQCYEHELTAGQRELVSSILNVHVAVFGKWAGTIAGRQSK